MSVQERFNRFLTNINLDTGRRGRIDSAYKRLQEYCLADPGISLYSPHFFFQGSYANGLAVKPATAKLEYDVDVVVLLSLPSCTAAAILDWFQGRLALDLDYKSRIIRKDKCVRLNYAGDFHVDVVPAHRGTTNDGKLQIPSRTGGWKWSHPKGFTAWCREQDRRTRWTQDGKLSSSGDFQRAVKMLKRWRDVTASAKAAVPSIIFTTLLGPRVPTPQPFNEDKVVILRTLEALNTYLQANPMKPQILNPSLRDENLAESWSQADYTSFRGQIGSAVVRARRAMAASSEVEAAREWQGLFGTDFPVYI